MVLGLLIISAIPTVTGVAEGISSKKQQNAAMKEKIKFNMTATLSVDGGPPTEAWIVLHGGRMWIDHPQAPRPGHKFNGYYFKYPSEAGYQGMVSTIQDDPPMLNWLYADKDTGAVRYGSRKDTAGHVIGPWGWSEDEQLLTMDDDDWRFIAVEEDVPLAPMPSTPPPTETSGEGGGGGGGGGGGSGEETAASGETKDAGEEVGVDDGGREQETVKCWAVYLSRDRDGSLKPKAERANGEGGEGEGEDEDEGVDVRYTHNWAPIRLLRKLQLGVDSSWVKGAQGNR